MSRSIVIRLCSLALVLASCLTALSPLEAQSSDGPPQEAQVRHAAQLRLSMALGRIQSGFQRQLLSRVDEGVAAINALSLYFSSDKRLSGHTSAVYSVALSPDGQQLVSGSDDHTIRIWKGNLFTLPSLSWPRFQKSAPLFHKALRAQDMDDFHAALSQARKIASQEQP